MEITITTIKAIFSTADTAKAVAKYTGLIESLGVKIDRLSSAKLDTALRELDHARNANCIDEKKSALRSARAKFSEALSLERKEKRRLLAFLGLGMCFAQLGEKQNLKNTLLELCLFNFRTNKLKRLQEEISSFASNKIFGRRERKIIREENDRRDREKREEDELARRRLGGMWQMYF